MPKKGAASLTESLTGTALFRNGYVPFIYDEYSNICDCLNMNVEAVYFLP